FTEEEQLVAKDNTFRFDNDKFKAPVHMRQLKVQIRFHPKKRDKIFVFFNDKQMGYAHLN
ncbi:MAG TPA: Mu transposase C-terminal domain-containing protein, partial [Candidatus Berkiella sp.]|nr:Mu transposase C-terminal domain-containing protein [Candidatus Berkiella sp.]